MGSSRNEGHRGWHFTLLVGLASLIGVGTQTLWNAPPRYDGAGYAVLGKALSEGDGYRAIDHPDAPWHGHFPPGYPLVIAVLGWLGGGLRWSWLHGASAGSSVLAAMLIHRWFSGMWRSREAFWTGMAVAINWRWTREGGAIRSESLFLFWMGLTLVCSQWIKGRQRAPWGLMLGLLLGAMCLTRQAGVVMALAVLLDLWRRGEREAALLAVLCGALIGLPWVVWQALVVRDGTQASYLAQGVSWDSLVSQIVFYVQRIPDQVVGPVVEWATVYSGSRLLGGGATLVAVLLVSAAAWGWWRLGSGGGSRLLGWIPGLMLGLLIFWPFTEAGRFLIPLLPWLVAGLAEGSTSTLKGLGIPVDRSRAAMGVCLVSLPFTLYGIATGRAAAAERTHAAFDAACRWIGEEGTQPGPILTRQPGEAYWLSGRKALSPEQATWAIEEQVRRYGVAYLILDEARYTNAPVNPLSGFVRETRLPLRAVGPRGSTTLVLEVAEEQDLIGNKPD